MMRPKPPPGTGRPGKAAFLKHREMVRAQLEQGIAAAHIFEANRALFPFTYSNFAKYVRRYLPGVTVKPLLGASDDQATVHANEPTPVPAPMPERVVRSSQPRAPIIADGDAPKTFTHNPVPHDTDKLF